MSQLPPNPYNNVPGAPSVNANPGPTYSHSPQLNPVPSNQLPPGYSGLKQDANSNSPLHTPYNSGIQNVNNFNQSASSSPAFNHPGMMPPGLQSSPIRPVKPLNPSPNPQPITSGSPRTVPNANPSPTSYPPNFHPQQRQINDNAPPLIPSSQYNQPLINGPPLSSPHGPPITPSQFPVSSSFSSQPPMGIRPPVSGSNFGPPVSGANYRPPVSGANYGPPVSGTNLGPPANMNYGPPMAKAPGTLPTGQPNVPKPGPPLAGALRNSPLMTPPLNGPSSAPQIPASTGPPSSGSIGQRPVGVNGSHFQHVPPMSVPPIGSAGPANNLLTGPIAPVNGPPMGPPISGAQSYPGIQRNGPSGPISPSGPIGGPMPPNSFGTSQNMPLRPQAMGPQSLPPMGHQMTPASGSLKLSGPPSGPPGVTSGPPGLASGPAGLASGPTGFASGPPGKASGPPGLVSGPLGLSSGPMGLASGPPGLTSGPVGGPLGLSSGPIGLASGPPGLTSGPLGHASGPTSLPSGHPGPAGGHPGLISGLPVMPTAPQGMASGPPGMAIGPPGAASGAAGLVSGPSGQISGPPGPKSNMQNRYPQMPSTNYNQQPLPQQNMGQQYAQPYNTQGMTQQMGQLSVTKQGFDQLWGHHMMDLLQCRHILPEYPEEPPAIKLGHQFAESPNCSPDIFRCTINRIPDTNNLLQKSRLPLGILIHPFKDLNHLPVIQCSTIVRCRACRTYINPFVYFVDSKRWKCNLCYRVNDLPEEFQYDPVSKSYGDPSRRPEIKSATIEFIAPGEYMLRPPQPAVYLFLLDVSQHARDSGYLQVVCDTLKNNLEQLPGDSRTQIGFICYDAHIHYYFMSEGLNRPKEMTVLDIDDVFLPSPESLMVNIGERRELIRELLTVLPQRHAPLAAGGGAAAPGCALGAALQAAYKLMAPTGGRITVFQTCLPNVGPGALQSREDPNARAAKEVQHLSPATDFYKRLALECSGAQVAVDLFLLNSQYADLATLSGMSKFSAGSVYHIPLFAASRSWQCEQLARMFARYLTRKIGFEAVMRVRCTRGISIHTFHGNFFVRSTDLLSLPNVSPDAGFGMQLSIDESLADLQQVCFQAALLYTSSKGERRIRVHTMALPIASSLTEVLHAADQQCIIGLLSKMAVDRCASASMSEAREALMNVAVDALSAHRLAQNLPVGSVSTALHAPASLRLLPLYLLALLKRKAFRTGTSTRLDDRVADMCDMKTMPLSALLRAVYPDLYCISAMRETDDHVPDPPRMHLSAERINSTGAYLLDDGETMLIYVCHAVSPAFLSDTFGVAAFSQLQDEARTLPSIESDGNEMLHAFIDKLNDDRPYPANILLLKDNSPARQLFTERLVDDRVESAFSYYEFLQHVKTQVK